MDFNPFFQQILDQPLDTWREEFRLGIEQGLSRKRYGDLPRWEAALNQLPKQASDYFQIKQGRVCIGQEAELSNQTSVQLREALLGLHPWRKGPFEFFGVHIDTEWRSDWKWDRVEPLLTPVAGQRLLDVGCGNGYHVWRMLAQGADQVIGVDPAPLFNVQFMAMKQALKQAPNGFLLPMTLEQLPERMACFDKVFSMGVLYHRRSPFDHLLKLKDCLRPGGELILETLVIDGQLGEVLVPEGRYGKMRNVWFLPSPSTLESWLGKCGFEDIRTLDVNQTTIEEQRATEWMRYESLKDFLNPTDANQTLEGHPAPVRAICLAKKPCN